MLEPLRPDILVADFVRVEFDADFSVVLATSIHVMLGVFVFQLLEEQVEIIRFRC